MKSVYKNIAVIHKDSITTGFLSLLGVGFLSSLYKAIDKCPYSFISVKKDDEDNVVGFISGTTSVKKMYKWILVHYGFLFSLQLVSNVFRFSFLKKILETLLYTFKKKDVVGNDKTHNLCDVELLSMAISGTKRGTGLGTFLISDFEKWLKTNKVKEYKVVTFSEDPRSNGFYQKNGFVLKSSFRHHENLMNEYLKEI